MFYCEDSFIKNEIIFLIIKTIHLPFLMYISIHSMSRIWRNNNYYTTSSMYVYIYIYIYIWGKNPRGRSIQFECLNPTAINCMINLGLKIHQNSHQNKNIFYIKIKRKKSLLWCHYQFISGLWWPSTDGERKIQFSIWISFRYVYIASRHWHDG